jgi:hypothetical protein
MDGKWVQGRAFSVEEGIPTLDQRLPPAACRQAKKAGARKWRMPPMPTSNT